MGFEHIELTELGKALLDSITEQDIDEAKKYADEKGEKDD